MPKLILIDGSSYLYRAFHALPPLTNAHGEPTGALFGVVNMLRATLKARPDYLAFVSDAPGRTFRDDLYDQYKANRPPMPDDLRAQVEPMLAIVGALGFPILRVAGVEADDVIGTLARQAEAAGIEVVVSTGDKDMAQLVSPHITLVNTMTNTVMDADAVMEKFGVRPEQIVDFLALTGDTVDNVPGVPKCGPKTAAKWLAEYDSARRRDRQRRQGRRQDRREPARGAAAAAAVARAGHDQDRRGAGPGPHRPGPARRRRWRNCASSTRATNSRQALKELDGGAADATAAPASPSSAVAATAAAHGRRRRTPASPHPAATNWSPPQAALDAWLEKLRHAGLIAFDTETTSIDAMQADIVGPRLAVEPGQACYIPLATTTPVHPTQLDRDSVLAALKPIFEDPARPKLGQHAKYDINMLAHYGIAVQGLRHDSMLESYIWNATATRHDMDSLAQKYLGYDTIKYEEVAGKGAKQIAFSQVDLDTACGYAAEDADITLRLHHALWPKLESEPQLRKVYEEIEIPLVPVLAAMERRGVLIDGDVLRLQSQQLGKRMVRTADSRPMRWPGASSISIRPSSCRRSCSTSWACRRR